MERPALGKMKVGDEVLVWQPRHGGGGQWIPWPVAKVGRVWITVRCGSQDIRFRIDTQRGYSEYSYGFRFATHGQRAYDEKIESARKVLSDAGVDIAYHSPIRNNDAAICAMAGAVRKILDDAEI